MFKVVFVVGLDSNEKNSMKKDSRDASQPRPRRDRIFLNGQFLRNSRSVSVFSPNWDLEHKYIKVWEVWRLLGTKMN